MGGIKETVFSCISFLLTQDGELRSDCMYYIGRNWAGLCGRETPTGDRSHTPASWQHKSTSEKMIGSEKTPHEAYFLWDKESHWASTAESMLFYWTSRIQNKVTAKHCQDKEKQSFRKSFFTEKSVRYTRNVGQRWTPQCCSGTMGDCLGSELFLSFFTFLGSRLLALPAYSVNINSFLGLQGS